MPKCQLLFSAVFGFRNPSKEIFSELDEIKAQGPIFSRSFQKSEGETKWGHEVATPPGGAAQALVAPACGVGPSGGPLTYLLRLLIALVEKPPVPRATIQKTFQRCRRRQSHIGGFRRSPPAPCRRGDSSPGELYTAMVASGVMSE